MKDILIKGGEIVDSGKILKKDILISGERIKKVDYEISVDQNYKLVDAKNKLLIPGLIDDQVHFREPGLTHKGDFLSESKAAVAGGITSFIEMPNTKPQTTTKLALDKKYDLAKRSSWANFSFMFGGTNDNFTEIKSIDKNKIAGFKLFLGSSTGNMLVDDEEVLEKIFRSTNLPISVHCEDEDIIKSNIKQFKLKYGNEIPIKFHPLIRSRESCIKSTKKAIRIAKKTGAKLHVFHLSTGEETNFFSNELPLKDKKITSEVCVHHLWFDDSNYDKLGSKIKWNPAIKSEKDRDALWDALNDDRIDIIASDHAPHTLVEKNQSYLKSPSGGPMVQHNLLALIECYKRGKIKLEKIVEKACHNPAILFKIKDRGRIKEKFFADIVMIDLNSFTNVNPDNILYKCGWSPFEGFNFSSKIISTWINGQCAYSNGSFLEKPTAKPLEFML